MAVRVGSSAVLDDEVDQLRAAGERFDQGRLDEATTMAAHIRRLVHRTDDSPALIDGLGLGGRLTWVDTAGVPSPKTACATACLTLTKVSPRARNHREFVPKMGLYPPAPIRTRDGGQIDRGSRIPFEHWWTNPVIRDVDGTEYTRKQLVLALASRPGSARDPETWAASNALRASATLSAPVASNPVLASIRQIAYEVVQSITQQRTLIDDAATPLAG
ncbi:hypothetical protein [Mycolicibacterium duvalii]|uniref:hypothetical protein n=1 Tax=Mycolicibacterium duvalii TaxID=39688 RepID=UPI0015D3EE9C|nr:hypothetical protein [Mycolicibacterium duvalii]MCV7366963.1 hypothetical protein [Mycolicibacterium duvalii]